MTTSSPLITPSTITLTLGETQLVIPPNPEVQPPSFGRYKAFRLRDSVEGYFYETDDHMAIEVKKSAMIDTAQSLLSNPFTPGLWYVTSSLNSSKSNLFIATILRIASRLYLGLGYPKARGKDEPSARRTFYGEPELRYVISSFRQFDQFLQYRKDHRWPIVLGIVGFDFDSTDSKREQLRDMINLAGEHDITVLVGASGCNPHQLEFEVTRVQPDGIINFGFPELSKSVVI